MSVRGDLTDGQECPSSVAGTWLAAGLWRMGEPMAYIPVYPWFSHFPGAAERQLGILLPISLIPACTPIQV